MSAVRSFVRRVWGGAHTRSISWGFIDQTFSSATNFGLTLLAGRMLGPSGLGTVFLGFSVFLIATGLQRRLVTEPLLAASSAVGPDERRLTGDYGVTLAVGTAVAMSAGTAAFGLVVPGFAGRGVLLVSPWIGFAMVQDMWRSLLFRDGRGSSAAANDGVWALVMAV